MKTNERGIILLLPLVLFPLAIACALLIESRSFSLIKLRQAFTHSERAEEEVLSSYASSLPLDGDTSAYICAARHGASGATTLHRTFCTLQTTQENSQRPAIDVASLTEGEKYLKSCPPGFSAHRELPPTSSEKGVTAALTCAKDTFRPIQTMISALNMDVGNLIFPATEKSIIGTLGTLTIAKVEVAKGSHLLIAGGSLVISELILKRDATLRIFSLTGSIELGSMQGNSGLVEATAKEVLPSALPPISDFAPLPIVLSEVMMIGSD